MFQRIQCVTSITPLSGTASVSCKIRAKLIVPWGASLHWTPGEEPSVTPHVYWTGIQSPSEYADVIILNFEGGGAACCCAATASAPITSAIKTMSTFTSVIRIEFVSLPHVV